MKLHIWNAFASNNSGSYTLVGRFASEELASQVAAELSGVLEAQARWVRPHGGARGGEEHLRQDPSPLRALAQAYSLTYGANVPEDQGGTRSWSTGHQVFIYDPWTLGLPSAYEQFLRVRGGKVETRIPHAHGDLVSLFELRGTLPKRTKAETLSTLVKELYAEAGPLVALAPFTLQPLWREGFKPGEPVLTLGVAFAQAHLIVGFSAVEGLARRHGLEVSVRVFEHSAAREALASLRPLRPPPGCALFDVWVLAAGPSPRAVSLKLQELRHGRYVNIPELLKRIPDTVLERLSAAHAERAVRALRECGADAELRPAG